MSTLTLGLDIGTNSIGWCVVSETDVLALSSRIIPMGAEKDDFEKGKTVSKNADRRLQRGIRRGNQRYKLRRKMLQNALGKLGLLPDEHLRLLADPATLYGLRIKALNEAVSAEELGRIFLLLNQRRGFKSNRLAQNEEDGKPENKAKPTKAIKPTPTDDHPDAARPKKPTYLDDLKSTDELIDQAGGVGHYLMQGLAKNPYFRIRNHHIERKRYMEEFDAIWAAQAPHHPEVLTEENRKWIRDKIIYFQRQLKSQKKSIGICQFENQVVDGKEVGKKVCPKTAPIAQEVRIWQMLNNLRAFDAQGRDLPIAHAQRQKLFDTLALTDKLEKKQIIKQLGFADDVRINFDKIAGQTTRVKLQKALEKAYGKKDKTVIALLDASGYMEDLWHMIYSIEDATALKRALVARAFVVNGQPFYLNDVAASALNAVHFERSYGSLSARALKKLLPHLQLGKMYSEACKEVYGHHSHFEKDKSGRALADSLAKLHANTLRNPVVEQVVNETIGLVNALLHRFGPFAAIRVELARELKQDKGKREATHKRIEQETKERDDIKTKLIKDFSLKAPSANDILRYQLWLECGKTSPYTGNPIPASELFNGQGLWDIEHIFPKSRFFDDSAFNKTLCERNINKEKNKMTAYEYIHSRPDALRDALLANLDRNMPYNKRKRMLEKEIPEDFVERQLKATQYISVRVVDELMKVCPSVGVTSGAITSHLRHEWGLDDMLYRIVVGRPRDHQNRDNNEPFTKRDDHRHHAVDAVVIAMTTQAMIQRLNRLNAQQGSLEGRKIAAPWGDAFVARVEPHVRAILVSHKFRPRLTTSRVNAYTNLRTGLTETQRTVNARGALHKDTMYGQITRPPLPKQEQAVAKKGKAAAAKAPQTGFTIRKALTALSQPEVDRIVDHRLRALVKERLAGKDVKNAFKDLDANPIWQNEAKGIAVKSVKVYADKTSMYALRKKENGDEKDFVQLRNNHHIAIYEDALGNRSEEVVSQMEAVKRKLAKLPVVNPRAADGRRFMFSMQINEMFLIDLDPEQTDVNDPKNARLVSKHLYRVQKLSSQYYVFRHHLATTLDNDTQMVRIQSMPNTVSLFKVRIDITGQLLPAHD